MCRWQGPSPPDDTSFPQAIPGAFWPGIIGPFLALVLPFFWASSQELTLIKVVSMSDKFTANIAEEWRRLISLI